MLLGRGTNRGLDTGLTTGMVYTYTVTARDLSANQNTTAPSAGASAAFTDATISWTTGSTVAANQPLAIRIAKEGGTDTVVDFDNTRFTATELPPTNTFANWISNLAFGLAVADQGFDLEPDGDRLGNRLEAWFGTHPGQSNTGLIELTTVVATASDPINRFFLRVSVNRN
jgi:hypothetical protein